MTEEIVKFFPSVYFITILFLYYLINYINFSRREILQILFISYCGWGVFLGSRNIYDDITLDPYIFHDQAKNLSIGELWSDNFPKIDILLQLIIKFFLSIVGNDILAMILTQLVLVSIIFFGVLYFTSFNPNSLLLTISFLVFTNTGVLLTGNFLRQGLAVAIFINILHLATSCFDSSKKNRSKSFKVWYLFLLAIAQIFSHLSSIYLLISLGLAESFQVKRLSQPLFLISFLLFSIFILFIGQFLFLSSNEIYGGYEGAYAEGRDILYIKLVIDAVVLFSLMLLKKILPNIESNNFSLLFKSCIMLFIACLFYSYAPVISLRLEYYLNFLLIIVFASLISSNSLDNRRIIKRITLLSITLMYCYSFFVYNHPSITRTMIF
ncbi:EpsG family protein [Fortiea contorta]|uniref:EpsG family protein n=1 Tax=Fortiea contorta TaxID=1892405 RepID=UPI0003489DF8|nr:EpsG family protein [Fortiea contorta]